mmetsp:Transcript_34739/g.77252  ORF Transcript_34739/g.77252 Transcript_34739/m.77252 type:complete len:237 (+) Transcript_34739:890-1600(+)
MISVHPTCPGCLYLAAVVAPHVGLQRGVQLADGCCHPHVPLLQGPLQAHIPRLHPVRAGSAVQLIISDEIIVCINLVIRVGLLRYAVSCALLLLLYLGLLQRLLLLLLCNRVHHDAHAAVGVLHNGLHCLVDRPLLHWGLQQHHVHDTGVGLRGRALTRSSQPSHHLLHRHLNHHPVLTDNALPCCCRHWALHRAPLLVLVLVLECGCHSTAGAAAAGVVGSSWRGGARRVARGSL